MKNFFFSVLTICAVTFFFACQKESSTASTELIDQIATAQKLEVAVSEVPASINEFVEENYSSIVISRAYTARGLGWEIELSNADFLYFDRANGCLGDEGELRRGDRGGERHGNRCMRGDSVGVADLAVAITDYVTANYAGETITAATVKPNGYTGVLLSNEVVLLFDADGVFIKECDTDGGPGGHGGGHGGGGHHGGGHDGGGGHHGGHGPCLAGDSIGIETLPAVVTDYVTATYPDETISSASQKPNGAYAVGLSSGTVLLFNAEGEFRAICGGGGGIGNWHGGTEVAVEDLPAAVTDYVTANYPDATIVKAKQRNDGNYFLRLDNGVKLVFDVDGNILFDSGN